MSLINPEANAIDRYLWDIAQDSIKTILKAVSSDQAAINPEYEFFVEKDLFRPTIESLVENNHLVNILVGTVTSDEFETNFDKNHIVTYKIDCYVQGKNEDDAGTLIPPDEAAVERLKYLCAMVEFGLTKLANFYFNNRALVNKVVPDKIDLTFNSVDDSENATTPYAPASFNFVCKFPYESQDLENLPVLEQALIDLTTWASKFIYP